MLKIKKNGFLQIMNENDKMYLSLIIDAVKLSDPNAEIIINKFPKEMKIQVIPSEEVNRKYVIQSLMDVSKLMNILIIFSKSLALSKNVSFHINLEN